MMITLMANEVAVMVARENKMEQQKDSPKLIFEVCDCGDAVRTRINDCSIKTGMYALTALVENIVLGAVHDSVDYDAIGTAIIKAVNVGLNAAKETLKEGEQLEKN